MRDTKISTLSREIDSLNKLLGNLQNQLSMQSNTHSKETSRCKLENSEINQKLIKSETKLTALSHEIKRVEASYSLLQDKLKSLSGDRVRYQNSYQIICKLKGKLHSAFNNLSS